MDQEMYMTEEELKNMSVEEIESWLESLAEAAEESGEEEPRLSLEDYYKAYESPEYKAFLEQVGSVDTTPMIFEDKDDIEAINRNYEAVKKLDKDTVYGVVYQAYDKLYTSYYPYLKRVNPFWSAGAERLNTWAGLQKEHPTVFTLDKKNVALFKELCSEEAYSMIGEKGYYALGALRMKAGRKMAAGIMIFSLLEPEEEGDEAAAVIRWLYVDENLRNQHVADDLMAELYHILNSTGIKMVACEIPMQGLLPVTLAGFLSSWWIFFTADPQMEDPDAEEAQMYMAGANVSPEEDITEEMIEAVRPLYEEEHRNG